MGLPQNPANCSGCRLCEIACSFRHKKMYNPKSSRIRVHSIHESGLSIPLVCVNCNESLCIETCPQRAIEKDPTTCIPLIDQELCKQCGLCVKACPYKAIFRDVDKSIIKCDLCGGDPECVKFCPNNAIALSNSIVPSSILTLIEKVS